MSALSALYCHLPPQLQNVAFSTYGYVWHRRRFGGIFSKELIDFKDREQFTRQQWNDYTTVQFRELLVHAHKRVPFYQQSFNAKGMTFSDLEKFELGDISRLPFLEKNDLRTFGKTTLLSSKRERGGHFFSSSGSTGTPTQILFSTAMHQRWSAGFEARIRHWAGVDRFMARGMIGGRRVVPDGDSKPPYYRFNYAEKQTYFSAYHISKVTAANYLEGMRRHGITYMTGYAMSNYFLARFFEEAGLQAPSLEVVITSSEKLTPEMRSTFGRVYRCKTYDSWSGVEACGLVSECEQGSLHINPDLGIIEILDIHGFPVKPGEVGEVVCTGLINFDQPLIRYRIGDMMRLSSRVCSCGRNMPVIEEILGRVEDTVIGRDGREMVRFHGIFVALPNVIEGQIIQWDELNFEVKVVTNGNWTEDEATTIRKRMISQLGDITVKVHVVDELPRNSNGKFQAVISHVKRTK